MCRRSTVLWVALLCVTSPSLGLTTKGGLNRVVAPQSVPIQLVPVLTGLSSPLYLTSARDGSNRIFIVERGGIIKVLQPGAVTPTVFLDITTRVLSGGERGLLGLAFHPNYENNRRFFVNYTRKNDGATVIAEYGASVSDSNAADLTETVILVIPQPFDNHNGGMIDFGPDGYLYIGMGDGGDANDPGNRAQNIEELLGKMLRLNIDAPDVGLPYSSPQDNPFFGPTAGRDEIFAVGFRNPFRWSFDRGDGSLWVGDVGQGAREEVDVVVKGGNYGWRIFEGTRCTNLGPTACAACNCIAPISEYSHTGGRCSITGGYVYRGSRQTFPQGTYVFADFCTGEIFKLDGSTPTLLLDTDLSIASFGEDEAGELYVVNLGGTVFRLASPSQRADTTGVFRPSNGALYLKNRNDTGFADFILTYGLPGDYPVSGDWDGDGVDTIGVYRDGSFYLRNSNTNGVADVVVAFGSPGDQPVVGDWNGDGVDTIGVYRNGTFMLRNSNTAGAADVVFELGIPGDVGIAGDWDGDGTVTTGVFRPSNGALYLKNANSTGFADVVLTYGLPGDKPVTGDWNGDGIDTIGVYRDGTFYLRNSNTNGFAEVVFTLGIPEDHPISGDWDGLP